MGAPSSGHLLEVSQLQVVPFLLWPHPRMWGCVHAVECVAAAAKLHMWVDSSEDEAPEKHTAGQDSCRPQLREGSPLINRHCLASPDFPEEQTIPNARTARWLQVLGIAEMEQGGSLWVDAD